MVYIMLYMPDILSYTYAVYKPVIQLLYTYRITTEVIHLL